MGTFDASASDTTTAAPSEQRAQESPRVFEHGASRLITCRLGELQPHPSYVRHRLTVPAHQLSALADRGELAFREPLAVTSGRIILDGYARAQLAGIQGRTTLPCLEYDLDEEQALECLLQKHRGSSGLNAFTRIVLALDLEPSLREKARSNQRIGGQRKASSILTAAARLDVRSEIAATAGVSVGNVTKVKQLTVAASPAVIQVLRRGEISIHRAWRLSKASAHEQREQLAKYQSERGIKKAIRTLISRHRAKSEAILLDGRKLLEYLAGLRGSEFGEIQFIVVKSREKSVCLSEALLHALGLSNQLPLA